MKKTRICILSIKTINKRQKISKIGRMQNQQYLKKKPVALLICSEFCCVHTDRALPLTIKCGWEFSTSQSSAIRSKMVSASCGFNTKYREVPMRFQTTYLSTFGNRHLRVSNKLKCSQTIAVDKPQKVHSVCLMVYQKEIQHDRTCTYVP